MSEEAARMTGARLSIVGLSRRYPNTERPALDGFELEVEPGETVCLVGPSGCGKSTTLRLIAGLDRPDAGEVRIDGRDMLRVEPQARDVAMVFQGFALYPHMTVREILAFPLKMRKVGKPERERTVSEVADLLGISALFDRRPGELSGGERQRVAMGRAIVRRPKVFLFDEPLSNLDAALRAELRVELARLLRRLGTTALYVTHDQVEAMTLGHRIALMRAGRLEQVDTPRRLYETPATRFVASFFGAPPMNLLEARREGETAVAGALVAKAPAGAGSEVVIGVRPEHLRIGSPTTKADLTFAARVTALEPLGAETHIELDAGGVLLRAKVGGFDAPAIGESVAVYADPERIQWFDARSDRAIAP